jgi:predicted HTH domain antitoxin
VFGSGVLQEEDQLGYTAKLIEVDMEAKESILRQKVVDLYL